MYTTYSSVIFDLLIIIIVIGFIYVGYKVFIKKCTLGTIVSGKVIGIATPIFILMVTGLYIFIGQVAVWHWENFGI